ncbi:MAG: 2,3-bisphosphoglycerate-independent phosphoglycerate mutase [Flavobacteriales bacterium]|nr:MAG: 2,3-bisphosphoglycerate-independent phosphoglycerate mutase [Flavobacteriales bacterium]
MILDGWGKSKNPKTSAIDNADTQFIDSLYEKYPNANLKTDGIEVGLPDGQMGNSEVGHLNLGAGRIVYQELSRINMSIEDGSFKSKKVLTDAFEYAERTEKNVHLMGLISSGGVHSHYDHLYELINISEIYNSKVFIHGFTDGRDVDPKSSINDLKNLEKYIQDKNCELASIIGRYYSMDRDNRWERTKLAYDLICRGEGQKVSSFVDEIKSSYNNNCTDEFLMPMIKTDSNNNPIGVVSEGDVIIYFNFRTDRGRQLTRVMTQSDFNEFETNNERYHFVTMTNYDSSYKDINVVFKNKDLRNTLGEVLEKNNKTQLRIAETEKYPHVTFFFSGGREKPFNFERRILKDSPKVATYDMKPEMSAYEITEELILEIENKTNDFICLNYANGDMVGHTGSFEAAVKACETIDKCVKKVITSCIKSDYTVLLISDHGNCDMMLNEDGSPNTAHTKNLVPLILINSEYKSISDGILADIAPTILKIMNIEIPSEMTQNPLV